MSVGVWSVNPRYPLFVTLLVCAIGALLRAGACIHDPIWHDEILSLVRMGGANKVAFVKIENSNQLLTGDSLPHLIQSSLVGPDRGSHFMPAFYVIAQAFSLAFGPSPIIVKVFPLLCGILLPLAVAFLTFRTTHSVVSAPLAALLVALNPVLIAYSVEGRPYSSMLLSIVLCLCALLSPWRARTGIVFFVVSSFGAFSHLLFLPIAWFAVVLKWLLGGVRCGEVKRFAAILTVVSLVALPFILSVLNTAEASHHFTSQTMTTEALVRSASEAVECLVGLNVMDLPYMGMGALCAILLLSLVQRAPHHRVVLLTMIAPFLGMFFADLAWGGMRSTVPRYSLTLAIAFSLAIATVIGSMWQTNRIVASFLTFFAVTAQLMAPSSVERHLKGGRYDELAWYATTYGKRECLILSTLPGNRSMEFAVNSLGASEIIPVAGTLSPPIAQRVSDAHRKGISILGLSSLDGFPPDLPGMRFRWREHFVGAQTVIYQLVPR